MKHIKTFKGFLGESEDHDLFFRDLTAGVKSAGGHIYFDDESDPGSVFALSPKPLTPQAVSTMFDSGRPAPGATMFYMENTLEEIEKPLKAAIKKMGLKVDVAKLFTLYL